MIYLDNQIRIPVNSARQGVILPFYKLNGIAAVLNDQFLIKNTDFILDANGVFLLVPTGLTYAEGEADEVIVGIQYDFEIEPTNLVELGEPGMVKRPEKLALYLRDSGECAVTINDKENKFGKTLAREERIDGEHQLSTKGGFTSNLKINFSGNGHKPFNLLAIGVSASVRG